MTTSLPSTEQALVGSPAGTTERTITDREATHSADVLTLGQRLSQAGAFVVVTPVYNRSYPASLRGAIDLFYQEWQLKPVGFFSTFSNFWETFDPEGSPTDVAATTRRASRFLAQRHWWATTLYQARRAAPTPSAKMR